jgi:hypothetical protein
MVDHPYAFGPLTGEGDVIEAIEGEGWRLEQIAYDGTKQSMRHR